MADAGAIRAGKAFVELGTEDSPLVKGLRAAETKVKAWAAKVTQVGDWMKAAGAKIMAGAAAVLAPLGMATAAFMSMGDAIAKASQRTGMSVEALSALSYAAEQSGADLETLEGGIRKMQQALAAAAGGSQSAQAALSELGLSVAQLKDLSPDKQFKNIADRLAAIPDPAKRTAAAMELFGKAGTRLLPLMADGAEGIEGLTNRAEKLGLVMSAADADAAVELGDILDDLWKTVKAGAFAIGAALQPMLKDLIETAVEYTAAIAKWIKDHKEVVIWVAKLAVGVFVAGAALYAFGLAVVATGVLLWSLGVVAQAVAVGFSAIASVLGFLLSPIGRDTAAAVGLGAYLVHASGIAGDALEWLKGVFGTLKSDALAAFQGIQDAMAAGDLALAAKVLWSMLKLEWQRGVNFLNETWIGAKNAYLAIWDGAVYGIARFFTNAWGLIQSTWSETVSAMSRIWTTFTTGVVSAWRTAQNWVSKAFLGLMQKLGVTDEQMVRDASQILDDDLAREQADRQRATEERLRGIEEERAARAKQLEEQRSGALAVLNEEQAAREQARQKRLGDEINAGEAALSEAQRQFAAARDEAAQKAAEARARDLGKKGQGRPDTTGESAAVMVSGTFSAAALRGFGSGTAADRTAKATEATAENTGEIIRRLRNGKVKFFYVGPTTTVE
jgi:septal ring factor EnvC (AmiA/AmiB activator)